ncbi:17700_t:CDS:2 [Cetraspora pellucida]|uniref:17700_t:CDS:1 n=1 Tax=Cetraspora pellucida TaxID=1433469 RepID=A0ACA9KNI6_9GLOM|nr:17700_t:CDS:2 [Cetraspora pellucida]
MNLDNDNKALDSDFNDILSRSLSDILDKDFNNNHILHEITPVSNNSATLTVGQTFAEWHNAFLPEQKSSVIMQEPQVTKALDYEQQEVLQLVVYGSGIDAMGITFLIASELLTNKTIPSYCWIFQQLKQLIDDTTFYSIQTLLTDREHALISAVQTEAPHIKHQLCIWHVEQNIIRNLNHKLKERFISFIKDFKVVMFEFIEN